MWALRVSLVLPLAVVACSSAVPRPADIRRTAASTWVARRIGCLDLRLAAAREPVAPSSARVFAFDFVNTCGQPDAVDFTTLRARALLADGRTVALALFDPAREVHAAVLATGAEGAEVLEFDPPAGHGAPVRSDVQSICLDLSGLSPEVPGSPDVCFRHDGVTLVPEEPGGPVPAATRSALPEREVSLTVGYRHFSRFGDGWQHVDLAAPPARSPSSFDVAAVQSAIVAAPYAVGSLLGGDTQSSGARRIGCLELRVEAVRARVAGTSVALAFMLGNRCTRATRVALASVRVHAEWAEGATRSLSLYDPASEVHAPLLEGRSDATELLQYVEPPDAPPGPAQSVCIDVSRAAPGEPAVDVAPICLSRTGRFANEDTIVGHQRFEAERWKQPPPFMHAFIETGLALNFVNPRIVDPAVSSWTVTATGGKRFAVDPAAFKKTATYAWDLRYAWFAGPFYAGVMMQIAAGALDSNVPLSVGGVSARMDNYLGDISIGGLGGIVWTRSTPTRLRSDVTLGVRALGSDVFPPGCGNSNNSNCVWPVSVGLLLLAPRMVLDQWLGPRSSVEAWVSADALHLPDFGVGLSIVWHPWAYDGLP